MTEQELRMECLRLALQSDAVAGIWAIERAEEYFAFVKSGKISAEKSGPKTTETRT